MSDGASVAARPLTRARLAASLGGRPPVSGQRIGLLGGSFNPAHAGHRHISHEALKRLRLDRVWWLVSPQNPLKPVTGMAPLAERMRSARAVAADRRIQVTDIERLLDCTATVDTLQALRLRFPGVRFVWLMGADNLVQISRWVRWPQIFHAVDIAVFDRPSYALKALSAKAARRFARQRVRDRDIPGLADRSPPAWAFITIRLSPLSATALRETGAAPWRAAETGPM